MPNINEFIRVLAQAIAILNLSLTLRVKKFLSVLSLLLNMQNVMLKMLSSMLKMLDARIMNI